MKTRYLALILASPLLASVVSAQPTSEVEAMKAQLAAVAKARALETET